MELKSMGITIDIDKHVFLREIRDAGKAEGKAEAMHSLVQRQLKSKFGELPKWAASRIETASTRDLESWADRLLNGDSLQAVIGKR